MQPIPHLFSIPFSVSVFCLFLLTLNGYIQGTLYLSPKVSFFSSWSELSSEFVLYLKLHIHRFTFIYVYFDLPFSHPAAESCKDLLQFVTMYFPFLPWRTPNRQQTLSQHISFCRSFMNMLNNRSKNLCDFTADHLPLFSLPECTILPILFN